MSTLQQLVLDRLAELDRTYREAETVAGGLVSRATLNNIWDVPVA